MKKIWYIVISIIVLSLIYIFYIAPEVKLPQLIHKILYEKVKYVVDNKYVIYASEQENSGGSILFKKVRADIDGTMVYGDKGVLTIKDNSLELTENVHGENSRGWEFETNSLNYDKDTKLLIAPSQMKLVNKKKKITIIGDTFTGNDLLNNIRLKGNAIFTYQKYTINSNVLEYDDDTDVVHYQGNVRVKGNDIPLEKSKIKNLSLMTDDMWVDSVTHEITIPNRYQCTLDNIEISGTSLLYNSRTKIGSSAKTSLIKDGTDTLQADGFSLQGGKKQILLKGNVNGEISGKKIQASILEILGHENEISGCDVILKRKDNTTIQAPNMYSNQKSSLTQFYGVTSDSVVVKQNGYVIKSKEIDYNEKLNTVEIGQEFSMVNTSKGIVASGMYLIYDEVTQKGSIEKGNILSPKGTLSADKIEMDDSIQTFVFSGNVHGVTEGYDLSADSMKIDSKNQTIEVTSPFVLKDIKGDSTLQSSHLVYSDKTKDLLVDQPLEYVSGKYTINADKLEYNTQSGNGQLSGHVKFSNPANRESGMTESPVLIKNRKNIEIIGECTLINGMSTIETSNITYNLENSQGVLNNSGTIFDPTRRNTIKFKNGDIDGKSHSVGLNYAIGTIPATSGSSTINFTADRFIYYLNQDRGISKTPLKIVFANITTIIQNGELDILHSKISGDNPQMSSTTGDKMVADHLMGNLSQLEYFFTGKVKGIIYPSTLSNITNKGAPSALHNQPIAFIAQQAQMFLQRMPTSSGSTQYITRRMELQNQCIVNYSAAKQKADYIEIDNVKQLIYAKYNAVFDASKTSNVGGKTDTIVIKATSDNMVSDLNAQTVDLTGNVNILNTTKQVGTTTLTSDMATIYLQSNVIVVTGHATLNKKESIITADKATLDMTTNKLIGNKNIQMQLSIPKN